MNKELQNRPTLKEEAYKKWKQVDTAQEEFRDTVNAMQGMKLGKPKPIYS